jgi:hypothetical protein
VVIDGKTSPDSIPSQRGSDIHAVMSAYTRHCTDNRIPADWLKFNQLAAASGPVAGPILDGLRDRYVVDWEHVYDTELTLALDEEFNPTWLVIDWQTGKESHLRHIPGVTYSEKPAAYIGTLDVLLLKETRAKIPDYKSHPAIFEADTFQSTLYPFMVFKHFPNLQHVIFELVFVRYINSTRSVTWSREEMPAMQAEVSRARERQKITHANPDGALALPCKVCVYCPLAKDFSCPISEWNEHTMLTLEQRLMWKVWISKLNGINNPILKEHAAVKGPIRYEDANGRVFEYGEMPVPETKIPLDKTTLQVLDEWKTATGEDLLQGRLRISSSQLKPLLKAKKREALKAIFEDSIYETSTKPKYAVRSAEGVTPDYDPHAEDGEA